MEDHALLIANSASMIDHFNKDNIRILLDMGYSVTVAANFQEGNSSTPERIRTFADELAAQGIEIIDLPIPRKVTELGKALRSVRILRRYLSAHPCRIVHTQTPFGGVVGRLAARKFRKGGTRVIYFVHGFHFFHGAGLRNYLLYYNVEKYLSRMTDCLITLNQEDYRAAKQKFRHPNVHYVPGVGVDTDAIAQLPVDRSAVRARFGLPEDAPVILTVAELIARKNVAGAIDAFAGSRHKDAVLVICGKGELLDTLSEHAEEAGVAERVIFAGYRTDVLELYRCADLFLFTSFQEGLSVAVMQAMAAGLPIVASDIRGNRDLLGAEPHSKGRRFLIPVRDTAAFTRRIDEILDDPALAHTLGEENYTNCKKYFDIRLVHQLMSDIYRDLTKTAQQPEPESDKGKQS